MMKDILFIVLSFVLCMLTACQQELIYDPFETSENGMSRYLSQIEETTYTTNGLSPKETVSILFSNPSYDTNGKLTVAYNNFTGYDANSAYYYSIDNIRLVLNCKNGEVISRLYMLKNSMVESCIETSNVNNFTRMYHYTYDTYNRLNKISIFDEEYDFRTEVKIEWKDGNIFSVISISNSGYSSRYDFKYSNKYKCKPEIPFFFTTCYVIGSVYGVDEFLSMQNYFGINISKNLPDEVYFDGKISQIFEYESGNKGCIYKINQVDTEHKKTYRTYTFKWN